MNAKVPAGLAVPGMATLLVWLMTSGTGWSGPSPALATNPPICPPVIQWQVVLGGPYTERRARVHQTADGGYLLGGQLYGAGMWVTRLDHQGSNVWERFYRGNLSDCQPTADGGFILCGDANFDPSSGNFN